MKRKVLIILSNRWNRLQKPRYLELDCDEKGNILKERKLRSQPREPRFDEVWENDEAKTDFTSTTPSSASTPTSCKSANDAFSLNGIPSKASKL